MPACWQTKYAYEFWRPITAIQEANSDGNALTTANPNWLPYGAPAQSPFTPSHPSYVSGHSTFGTAAFEAMTQFYGTGDVPFSLTSAELPGVVRTYDNFGQAIDENGRSRIYLGIHWNFDDEAGRVIGQQVAQHVAGNFLQPINSPSVSARLVQDTGNSDLDHLTSDPTVFGRVYGQAPVTALRAGIDNNNPAQFTDITAYLQTAGSFELDRAALETILGSTLADGTHTLYLSTADLDGAPSTVFSISFNIDTQAPVLATFGLDPAFDSEPLGDGQTTAMTVRRLILR